MAYEDLRIWRCCILVLCKTIREERTKKVGDENRNIRALIDVPGVIEAEVDLQTETTFVTLVAKSVPLDALAQAVQEAGYRVGQPQPDMRQES